MMSFCVQFGKWGQGLLKEAFRGKGEWVLGRKREGDLFVVGNLSIKMKNNLLEFYARFKPNSGPSRGGLEVEAWTDNSLHSASVGSNPV